MLAQLLHEIRQGDVSKIAVLADYLARNGDPRARMVRGASYCTDPVDQFRIALAQFPPDQQDQLMGTDLHAFVEYSRRDDRRPRLWQSFGARLYLHRDTEMFNLLGGVANAEPVFVRRGFPEDPAPSAFHQYWLFVSDANDEPGFINRKKALGLIASGKQTGKLLSGETVRVENPQWHSHTWLTTDEFAMVLNMLPTSNPYQYADYHAVLAAMQSLSQLHEVRLVIFFDN